MVIPAEAMDLIFGKGEREGTSARDLRNLSALLLSGVTAELLTVEGYRNFAYNHHPILSDDQHPVITAELINGVVALFCLDWVVVSGFGMRGEALNNGSLGKL